MYSTFKGDCFFHEPKAIKFTLLNSLCKILFYCASKIGFSTTLVDWEKNKSILVASEVNLTVVRVPLIEFSDVRNQLLVSIVDCKDEN